MTLMIPTEVLAPKQLFYRSHENGYLGIAPWSYVDQSQLDWKLAQEALRCDQQAWPESCNNTDENKL